MNARQQQLCVALGAAGLLAGCGPAATTAQAPGGSGAAAQAAAPAAAPRPCPTKWLTVRSSDDAHLEPTQRVRFIGPDQSGDYKIHLMLNPTNKEKHWLDKDFNAQADDGTGTLFYARVEVQDGFHGVVEPHDYKITMELQNGCLLRARLHTDPHPEPPPDDESGQGDHGGDVVLD